MAADSLSVNSDVNILAQKTVQTLVQEMIETIFRHIASVEQSDLKF